jgi:glycosyltransferase involved in cell wall biosynthesis
MDFVYHHRTAGRGAESLHIMHVVEALEGLGHTVDIVSPPGVDPRLTAGAAPLDKGGGSSARGLSRMWAWMSCHAPQIVFELAELAYNVHAARALRAALKRRPRAVLYERHACFLFAGVWAAGRRGTPVILEVNEVSGLERARGQMLISIMRAVERYVFSRADHILTVSSLLRDEVVRRGGRPGRVHVVPNAIDPKRFLAPIDSGAVRRQCGLDGKTVVGFVGWFDRWDRLELLMDAVKALSVRHPGLSLLLVGDGPVTAQLRAKAAREGLDRQVIFSGAVPRAQVPAYIGAMDICVLPDSNRFGSPMVLFEFMAMGRPVLAPDVPPVRDVIRDGENGIVIRPGAGSLQDALGRLLDDPVRRAVVGSRARESVLRQHTWDATARQIVALVHPAMERVA